MRAVLWSLAAMTVVWVLFRVVLAFMRGRERENESVTLVQTACCHEYRGVLEVKPDPPRSLRFVCKDPATCKRPKVVNYKSAS